MLNRRKSSATAAALSVAPADRDAAAKTVAAAIGNGPNAAHSGGAPSRIQTARESMAAIAEHLIIDSMALKSGLAG